MSKIIEKYEPFQELYQQGSRGQERKHMGELQVTQNQLSV